MAERAEERLELSDGPAVYLRRSSHRLTALGMIGHYTKIVLAAGAERAGVVDQNGDGRAKSPGDEGLPEVEGPSLAMAASLSKKTQGGMLEVTRLGVLGLGSRSSIPPLRTGLGATARYFCAVWSFCCSSERV